MQLVLVEAETVEQTARRFGRSPRAVRAWCLSAPISCRPAHGSRRVSRPLADLYAAGEHRALWALLDGDVAQIVADAFDTYGMGAVLASYTKKIGNAGNRGKPDLRAVSEGG